MSDSTHRPPAVRVASDVGGTFTDSIAWDEATRTITVSKVSTTPENRALGTVAGLRRALMLQGRSGGDVCYVGHGMTTATNAVIQRTVARTALLTNAGFRDLLLIGRQDRPSLYDIRQVRPLPLVPRELCYTVRGRLDATGAEVEPLDEPDLARVAAEMAAAGVEAVAVLFLHAYANPAHEQRACRALAARLPGVPVCASTDLVAEFREYERGSTCVLNACLLPVMERYLASLEGLLRDPAGGLGVPARAPVMVMEAAGGMMTVASARARPVHTVLSGPAGGVVAAARIGRLCGLPDLVAMDIGGTSTDISLIRGGVPTVTREAKIERVPIRLPVIDINAIGAGGGSIAWIDDGGALRVGPMSAEAVPGPACYGRGGTRATVTDANLVLGRFGPGSRLGGDLELDARAARRVVDETIARPLGLGIEAAAAGILRVAHANIVRGIRVVSVERGHDPREVALVAFGGAGPMHGSPIARELGMRRVLVPPAPGILCAFGQLVSDIRHDFSETHLRAHARFAFEDVHAITARLEARGQAALEADAVEPARRRLELRVDARYAGQSFELSLPFAATPAGWAGVPEALHRAHAERFGHHDPRAPVEIVNLGLTATGVIDPPELPQLAPGGEVPPEGVLRGTRTVWFESEEAGAPPRQMPATVVARAALLAGNVVRGPAIIDEVSATTVLYPGDVARVHPTGSLVVETGG